MKIINASAEIVNKQCAISALKHIERCGRTCYKSEDKITDSSATEFVCMLLRRGHESVLEHVSVTARIICDRGVSHELVRHRLCSFAQESTRYCNYSGSGVTFIRPSFWPDENSREYKMWLAAIAYAEDQYLALLKEGASPQEARSVLPNSTKTELVMTANLREWRHIFKMRTAKDAHPQCREVMCMVKKQFADWLPEVFNG